MTASAIQPVPRASAQPWAWPLVAALLCQIAVLIRTTFGENLLTPPLLVIAFAIMAVALLQSIVSLTLRPLYILSISTFLWYGVPMSYLDFLPYRTGFLASNDDLWTAYSVVAAVCTGGLFLGIFLRGAVLRADLIDQHLRKALLVSLLAALIHLYLIVTGQWTYSTIREIVNPGTHSPLVLFAAFVANFVLPIMAFVLGRMRYRRQPLDLAALAIIFLILISECTWLFYSGRRDMAIAAIVSLVFWYAARFGETRPSAGEIIAIVAVVATLFVIIAIAWQMFIVLRQVYYISTSDADIFSLLSLRNRINEYEVAGEFSENVVLRPFIIHSVAIFLNSANGYLLGEASVNSLIAAIPSIIPIGKADVLTGEPLWTAKLGVPLNDWANTLFLDAYADFGVAGFVLIGGIVHVCVVQLVRASTKISPVLGVMLFVGATSSALSVERQMTSFVLDLRNYLILVGLFLFALLFIRKRSE